MSAEPTPSSTDPAVSRPPSLAAQVSRAVVWNTLFVPLRLLSEVVSTLVKLNLLSQAGYGLLALIGGANNGLGTAVDLGTARALPKYIPELSHSGGPRAVLRLLSAVFALQMAVLLVIAAGLATAFRDGYLDNLRARVADDVRLADFDQGQLLGLLDGFGWLVIGSIVALLFLGACYDMLMAYLSSFFKQRAWNSITLAAGLLPQLLSVGAILLLPAETAIIGVLVASVLAPMIAVALAGWQVARLWAEEIRRPAPPVAAGEAGARGWLPKGFLRYSGVSFLMTATDFLASVDAAIYLAGGVTGAAVLKAGGSLARMALGYLYTPMVGVQVPLFARVRAGEGGTLNGAYQSLVRLQLLLLIPGGVGVTLLAEPALLVISTQYLSAAPIVWALVSCLFFECLLTTAHNALIVYERLGTIVASRLLMLALLLPLAWLLPPALGLPGVALAFGLARVGAGLFATLSGARLLGLRWPWAFTARVCLASAAMGLLILGMRGLLPAASPDVGIGEKLLTALLMLGLAAVGAAAFFAALRLLGGLDAQDKAQLGRMKLPLKKWIMRVV